MSQYQRMISYLYRYEDGVKKNNTGYARIELRGETCRVTVQMRDSLSGVPEVAFFRQEPQGVQRILAGQLQKNGNGFGCRIETRMDNMMNTGYLFSDMDGLMIYINDSRYYATTWKDITIHMGQEDFERKQIHDIEEGMPGKTGKNIVSEQQTAPPADTDSMRRPQMAKPENERAMQKSGMTKTVNNEVVQEPQMEDTANGGAVQEQQTVNPVNGSTVSQQVQNQTGNDIEKESEPQREQNLRNDGSPSVAACQCEACRQCPQRGRVVDFGRHILAMFPRMYPFEIDSMEECVRLELRDIGCLPVPYWSLAGNPFLLHGYYCYRHILFTRVSDGEYCIGVPGIYNQENQKQADHCGFRKFKTLSQVADRQGAFGYWLFPIKM